MRTDTLSYSYKMKLNSWDIYNILKKEQLKYFQSKDSEIQILTVGSKINQFFQTKTQNLPVRGSIEVTKMNDNKLFQLQSSYSKGSIIQTYELKNIKKNLTEVKYSEQNTFKQSRNQLGFMFFSIIYKLIYNYKIRNRLRYIENLALLQNSQN